ncbi:hypothetical protein CYMTET_9672 [Cymbomonas tetramitiformis]|uniref:VWFA domain-containing protein n=1 Tax=Cymbomonas tetramitiformis TaxID=36881 RepID=A0AAE0GQJ8_9CHLO|nr:hypothetical protein CYMTET_9672 [Cymbomonas tetramitiformis]
MFIVWVLDTSASMNQRTAGGLTLLDCAKSAVEHFLKIRSRDPAHRSDCYMLVTCDEGVGGMLADKFPFTNFTCALKAATAHNLSTLGRALKRALDRLNLQRLASGVDNYGMGRIPGMIEQAQIIVLTDGTALTSTAGVVDSLSLPMVPTPGSELTVHPFRWDQRVYAAVLRLSGTGVQPGAAASRSEEVILHRGEHYLSAMCEVTHGRCVAVTGMRALLANMEQLAARAAQPAVVINLDRMQSAAAQGGIGYTQLFVRPGAPALWPLPEGYHLNHNMTTLPPRDAHPTLGVMQLDSDPHIPPGFPVDKYDLEPCMLTQLLSSASPGACWQVFMAGHGGTEPCGYLKFNRPTNTVQLYVLPYNFPVLFRLLDQLMKMTTGAKMNPPPAWRMDMERYTGSLPAYYLNPLRTALRRMNLAPRSVPNPPESGVPFAIANYLKRVKAQARAELERMLLEETAHASQVQGPTSSKAHAQATITASAQMPNVFNVAREELIQLLSSVSSRLLRELATGHRAAPAGEERAAPSGEALRRSGSSGALDAMAAAAAATVAEAQQMADHTVPVAMMGAYQDALVRRQVPRDPLLEDDERARQLRPSFGNPFRRSSEVHSAVDEEHLEQIAMNRSGAPPPRKRLRRTPPGSPSEMGARRRGAGAAKATPRGGHMQHFADDAEGDAAPALPAPKFPGQRPAAPTGLSARAAATEPPSNDSGVQKRDGGETSAAGSESQPAGRGSQGALREPAAPAGSGGVSGREAPDEPTSRDSPSATASAQPSTSAETEEGGLGMQEVQDTPEGSEQTCNLGEEAVPMDPWEEVVAAVRAARKPRGTTLEVMNVLESASPWMLTNCKRLAKQLGVHAARHRRKDLMDALHIFSTTSA